LRDRFHTPVGFSDHSTGWHVAVAATALGAELIEKHFTLDRALPGPDHAASLEPHELTSCVRECREVALALGEAEKRRSPVEEDTARVARRSVVVNTDIPAGEILTDAMLTSRRPGTGISPGRVDQIVGRRLKRAVSAGTVLAWEMFE
jgi:N,N'-diacetyllegionaminate synthase